jgi:hypothetical protein
VTTAYKTELAVPDLLARVNILRATLDRAKKFYGDRFAPEFSAFDFIRDDELGLSRILAWLLDRDPKKGNHAQGSLFLKLFCSHYGIDWSNGDLESSSVRTEFRIPTGQLDILIQAEAHQKSIIIENKPRARDGADQIKKYLAWAQKQKALHRLIYLSGDGSDPDEGSISPAELRCAERHGTFKKVSYSDLIPWLDDCRKECRADRVTAFIRDFERYIEKSFKGVPDMTETQEITKLIAGSPELLHSAFSIFAAQNHLKLLLLDQLKAELENALKDEFLKVDIQNATGKQRKQYDRIIIQFNSESRCGFALEWGRLEFNNLCWGLFRGDEKIDITEDAKTCADLFGASGGKSDWWPWWKFASPNDGKLPLNKDWQYESQPWEEIVSGKMAKNIARVAKEFKGKINDSSLL